MRTVSVLLLIAGSLAADTSRRDDRPKETVELSKAPRDVIVRDFRALFREHGLSIVAGPRPGTVTVRGQQPADGRRLLAAMDVEERWLTTVKEKASYVRQAESMDDLIERVELLVVMAQAQDLLWEWRHNRRDP